MLEVALIRAARTKTVLLALVVIVAARIGLSWLRRLIDGLDNGVTYVETHPAEAAIWIVGAVVALAAMILVGFGVMVWDNWRDRLGKPVDWMLWPYIGFGLMLALIFLAQWLDHTGWFAR